MIDISQFILLQNSKLKAMEVGSSIDQRCSV